MARLEATDLETLRKLQNGIAINEAATNVLRAEFAAVVTEMFVKHSVTSQTNSVCLECGTFNRQGLACQCLPTA